MSCPGGCGRVGSVSRRRSTARRLEKLGQFSLLSLPLTWKYSLRSHTVIFLLLSVEIGTGGQDFLRSS